MNLGSTSARSSMNSVGQDYEYQGSVQARMPGVANALDSIASNDVDTSAGRKDSMAEFGGAGGDGRLEGSMYSGFGDLAICIEDTTDDAPMDGAAPVRAGRPCTAKHCCFRYLTVLVVCPPRVIYSRDTLPL